MNDQKVCKIVTYVKPTVEMLELETEGSLLLTASGPGDSVRFGTTQSGGEGNMLKDARSSGRVTLN